MLLFSPCFQAQPSHLCWIAHLTTSIWASALISASQLLVFTWNTQVTNLRPMHRDILSTHNTPQSLSYYSYRSGVVSRASNSKLRNTTGRQIHGGRRGAVCVRAGVFSPGNSTIFCRYRVEPDAQIQSDDGHESHNTHRRFMLASGYTFKWFKTDVHVWSDAIQYFLKPRLIIYLLGEPLFWVLYNS